MRRHEPDGYECRLPLVVSLRQIDGKRDKGKHPPNFHFRSKPFLHVHKGPDRTYADVRFGGDFEPVTASTHVGP